MEHKFKSTMSCYQTHHILIQQTYKLIQQAIS